MTRLTDPRLAAVLAREHALARAQRGGPRPQGVPVPHPDFRTSERHRTAYLSIGPDQGRWLYGLVLASGAREIVEFGTSFGISTLYLAAAAAETGGRVTGSEYHPAKAEKARANLAEAGLVATILTGDARETLAGPGPQIDLLFLDGAKELYLPMLQLLRSRLHRGSIVVADNIPTDPGARAASPAAGFDAFIEDTENGFVTAVTGFGKGGMRFAVML